MDTKKINLKGLQNVLSPKEMKNIKGGSGQGVCCDRLTDYCSHYTCNPEYQVGCEELGGDMYCRG